MSRTDNRLSSYGRMLIASAIILATNEVGASAKRDHGIEEVDGDLTVSIKVEAEHVEGLRKHADDIEKVARAAYSISCLDINNVAIQVTNF